MVSIFMNTGGPLHYEKTQLLKFLQKRHQKTPRKLHFNHYLLYVQKLNMLKLV